LKPMRRRGLPDIGFHERADGIEDNLELGVVL
jgi:hypothetical protein